MQDADQSTRPDQPPDSTFNITCVGIRVSPFLPAKSTMCFGQFALSNITEDGTKFYCVISQLDSNYKVDMEDVLTNPPPTGRYDKISAKLIRRLSFQEEQRIRQLLMHEDMGDLRLTQFLLYLRTIAGPSVPSNFVRPLWTNRLPLNIQAIIATQAQVALVDVSRMEDNIAKVTPFPCVTGVFSPGDINILTARTNELNR
jgi:hypothetical protein